MAALALLCALTAAVDPRAEALNDAGKTLYLEQQDYAGAAAKFRAAIALAPDPRYFYNLCTALERLGQLDDALAACAEVPRHAPSPELADKAARRAAGIQAARPAPTSPPPAAPSEAPAEDADAAGYGWALGADVGFVHDIAVGDTAGLATNGLALRLEGEAILVPRHAIGAEVAVGLAAFPAGNLGRLSIIDVGAAATWHRPIWDALVFAPAAGLDVTFLRAGDAGYGTLGLRVDAGFEWVFPGGAHVLSVVPLGLGFYLPALGQFGGPARDSAFYGLDHGGATWSFTVGYRYRFSSSLFPGLSLE
jgi:hypothetical protein